MRTDEFDNHSLKQPQDKAAQLGGYVQSSSVSGTKPETFDYGHRQPDVPHSYRQGQGIPWTLPRAMER